MVKKSPWSWGPVCGLALAAGFSGSSAWAECTPTLPFSGAASDVTTGGTFVCSGNRPTTIGGYYVSPNLVDLNQTNITIVSGASVSTNSGPAVTLKNNNTFLANGLIQSGNGAALVVWGSGNNVTIGGTARSVTAPYALELLSSTGANTLTVNQGGVIQSDSLPSVASTYQATVWMPHNSGAQWTIVNRGTIKNTAGGYAIDGGPSAAPMTVVNGGAIEGSVRFGNQGTNTFLLEPGGTINGTVDATSGSNDVFAFGGTGSGTFDLSQSDQKYRGFESAEVQGSALWTVTGSKSGTTPVTIRSGMLRMNGSIGGLVTILSGGTLGGTGQVGSIDNQGIVGPGNSIGTLTVSGNYVQRSSGTLQIEVSPTASDKLAVGGTASLDGTLQVLPEIGTYTAGAKYPILTAQSVSGTFRTVSVDNSSRLSGLTPTVVYTGNEVDLLLESTAVISAAQQTESARVVAPEIARETSRMISASISTRVSSILFPANFSKSSGFGGGRSPAPAPATGPAPGGTTPGATTPGGGKSPDKNGTDKAVPGQNSSALGGVGLSAGDAPASGGWDLRGFSAWGDASWSFLDNTDSVNKYNGTHKVASLGADYRVDDWLVVGAVISPDATDINLKSVDGNRNSMGATFSTYAAYKFDETYAVSGILGYGKVFNFTRQPVSGLWVKDHYPSDRYLAQVSASAAYMLQDDLRVIPTLSYTHAMELSPRHYSSDGTEISLPSVRLGTVKLGAQLDYAVSPEIVPFVTAGIERDLVNSGGSANRTGFQLGGGIQAPLDDNITLGAVVSSNLGRGAQSETQLAANIRYSF